MHHLPAAPVILYSASQGSQRSWQQFTNQVVMDTSTTWRELNTLNPSNLTLSLGACTRLKNY
ncbi:hypothetical protein Nmel_001708 [Mimus melanotis]